MSEKSINWERSIELNPGFTIDELKARFKRFPKSHKRIIAVCVDCGTERNVRFEDYRDLCRSCTILERYQNPEAHEISSNAQSKRYEDPKEHEKTSNAVKKHWCDPKVHEKAATTMKKRFADADGDPIENHHIIYDHNDKTRFTIQLRSSAHRKIHVVMRRSGFKIPHINIKEVING